MNAIASKPMKAVKPGKSVAPEAPAPAEKRGRGRPQLSDGPAGQKVYVTLTRQQLDALEQAQADTGLAMPETIRRILDAYFDIRPSNARRDFPV